MLLKMFLNRDKMFKQMLFSGIIVLGQMVTFGAATIVVLSDKQSFTYKSCTKQNMVMQEVIFYYRYNGKVGGCQWTSGV